jgi:hypothetical protein
MPREDPFKDAGRDEDPFKDAGRDEDPFKDAGRDEDPFKDAGKGAPDMAFGGGGGWVVVAFVSPVGLSVPELAVRMLRGKGPPRNGGRKALAIAKTAVLAQEEARRRSEERKREKQMAGRYQQERVQKSRARYKK